MKIKRVSFWMDIQWASSFYTENRSFDVDESLTDEKVIIAMREEAKRIDPHYLDCGLRSIEIVVVKGGDEDE